MSQLYRLDPVFVRNRLGQGMSLQALPFSLSNDHVCVLVQVPDGTHHSILAKNAENIVFQLRERFSRTVKKFSMVEIRKDGDSESWYSWQFNWLGNTPLDSKSQRLTDQQIEYYQRHIVGFDKVSGDV